MIPKTIVQTHRFDKNDIPPYIRCPMETWQELNPDFAHLYFGQIERDDFMSSFQLKEMSDIYFYPRTIQTAQADIFRTCFIYDQGGIYADSDLMCVGKVFDHINAESKLSVEAADHNFYTSFNDSENFENSSLDMDSPYLQNHFFAAQKKHKYFESLFEVMIKNSEQIIYNKEKNGQQEIGLHEVGPSAWCQAFASFASKSISKNNLEIDIVPATHSGLFIDIGGATTWNDGPLTNSRLQHLPKIFGQMLRGGTTTGTNVNKNVGSLKFHISDGHGNAEYMGSYGF